MHLFLISLPEPSPRRQSGLEKVRSTGLHFEIVDGVEASKWHAEELPVDNSVWGRRLRTGEIGCYMAHLRAMQRIVEYRLPWGCILEDDFCFEANPDFGLADIEPTMPADFHFIHLQRDLGINLQFQMLESVGMYHRIQETPLCAAGYIISNPLAQYILEHHQICQMPLDHLFSKLSYEGNFYIPHKPLVGCQLGFNSTIQPVKILLDCGTHFGQGIAHFFSSGLIDESVQVHAFEANPACQIAQRMKDFPLRITTHERAVWVEDGWIDFEQDASCENQPPTGQSSCIQGLGFVGPGARSHVKVPCIDLATFINSLPHDANIICKMDIEGSEFRVLRHLIETGTIRRINTLYVEFHERFIPTESAESKQTLIAAVVAQGVTLHEWY